MRAAAFGTDRDSRSERRGPVKGGSEGVAGDGPPAPSAAPSAEAPAAAPEVPIPPLGSPDAPPTLPEGSAPGAAEGPEPADAPGPAEPGGGPPGPPSTLPTSAPVRCCEDDTVSPSVGRRGAHPHSRMVIAQTASTRIDGGAPCMLPGSTPRIVKTIALAATIRPYQCSIVAMHSSIGGVPLDVEILGRTFRSTGAPSLNDLVGSRQY